MQRRGRGGVRGRRGNRVGGFHQKSITTAKQRGTSTGGRRGRGRGSMTRISRSNRSEGFGGRSGGITKSTRGRRERGRGRGRVIPSNKPVDKTGAQLDKDLEEYFKQDPTFVSKKLDNELDDYWSQMPAEQQQQEGAVLS